MEKFRGTTGDWEITDISETRICINNSDIDVWCLNSTEEEMNANAQLIADAGTTANKCGLLPSELLKQRDELIEALKGMTDNFYITATSDEVAQDVAMSNAKKAINNTK